MITRIFIYLSIILAATSSFAQDKEEILICKQDSITEKYHGFFNSKGEMVISGDMFQFIYSDKIDKIGFVIFKEGPEGIQAINRKAEPLFEVFCFDNGPDYVREGLFRIIVDGKMGFANMDGEIIIEPQFDFVHPFQECGYAVFNIGGKKVRTNPRENWWTWKGGKWGLVNKKGEIVIPPTYDRGAPAGFIIDDKRVPIEEILHLEK